MKVWNTILYIMVKPQLGQRVADFVCGTGGFLFGTDNAKVAIKEKLFRMDMSEAYKNFFKTKSIKLEHLDLVSSCWENRKEINIDGFDKVKKYTAEEIKALGYNLDLCGFPNVEEEILEPEELISNYRIKRESLNSEINNILAEIEAMLEKNN